MSDAPGKPLVEVFAGDSPQPVSLGQIADYVAMVRYHLDLASITRAPAVYARELQHAQEYLERIKTGLDRALQEAKENP